MLNLETTSIKVLEESYKSAHVSNIVLSIVLAVIGIGIFIWILTRDDYVDIGLLVPAIVVILITASVSNFIEGNAPYYDIKVEVQPTKELTGEKLRNNDNFREINNKIYFKTNINKKFLMSTEKFNIKEDIEKEINKKFEDAAGKIWIEDRKVK